MNKKPLVSILMNCYNGEKYLKEAIDSIYAQTYTNWEIVFVDNCFSSLTRAMLMLLKVFSKIFVNSAASMDDIITTFLITFE